ncbi:RNA polymerase sigma factor [Porticoccus sp. GXU_MW_L64]
MGVVVPLNRHEQVIHQLFTDHHDELCRHVVQRAGLTYSEAEDVVQTAFAQIAEKDLDSISNHRAFLYKSSYNLAIDVQRKKQVRQRYATSVNEQNSDNLQMQPGPERVVEGSRQLNVIARALWGMPNKRRKLLMMSRFDGLSYAEISRRVKLSETVVRKHIAKALTDCQKALQNDVKQA